MGFFLFCFVFLKRGVHLPPPPLGYGLEIIVLKTIMSKNTKALIQKTTCRGILFCYITLNHLSNVSTRHIFTMLDLCCSGQHLPLIGCRKVHVYTGCTPNRYTGVLDFRKCTLFWIIKRAHGFIICTRITFEMNVLFYSKWNKISS